MENRSPHSISEEFFADNAAWFCKKGVPERYEVASGAGVLETMEGRQGYSAGYYIITGPGGEKYSMPPAKFLELKDDNGDGTASPKRLPKLAKLADASGSVTTSWGESLRYSAGEDYIVRHGRGDYGVVKAAIFRQTYESSPPPRAHPHGEKSPRPLRLASAPGKVPPTAGRGGIG